MRRVEAGVEMGDRDAGLLGADLVASVCKFAEGRTGVPSDAGTRGASASRLLVIESADRAGAGRHAAVAVAVLIVPALDDVGLDLQDVRPAGGSKRIRAADDLMRVVPRVFGARGFRAKPEPGRAMTGGRAEITLDSFWGYREDRLYLDCAEPEGSGVRSEASAVATYFDKKPGGLRHVPCLPLSPVS